MPYEFLYDHDAELPGDNSRIASATSIRKALIEKGTAAARSFLPEASARELEAYRNSISAFRMLVALAIRLLSPGSSAS
jgi:predicted nucleotidyltransferase